jgi:prepilin signal peptidase PulO-like enzyme (type II secretory pathway)
MESDDRTLDREAAAAQLALLRADRIALAEKATQPWWYHVLLGLLLFVLTAGQGLDDAWAQLAVLAVFFAGNHWLTSVQRRRTGMEVDGGRPGASRRAYLTWTAIGLAVFLAALVAEDVLDVDGALLAAGLVLGVGVALVSRWYSHCYVAGLRRGL